MSHLCSGGNSPTPLPAHHSSAAQRSTGNSIRARQRRSLLLALAVALACVCCFFFSLPGASAQQIRIPLTRLDVGEGHHPTRSPQRLAQTLRAAEEASASASGARSFNLFGPRRHTHSSLNLAMDSSRRVSLRNYFNRMYTGLVSVGTPAKEFRLVFDTGSADMWVFAEKATATKLPFVRYYDADHSSTAVTTTEPWSIEYGKGSAAGVLVRDTVSLAGLQATGVTFAHATSWSDDFESPDMPLDGLLGLAFSKVSSANSYTVIDMLKEQGKINNRVFSFYLTTDNPVGSEFVLGAPDMALAGGGNLTYMDVESDTGMWLLSMQGVHIGSEQITSYCPTDCAALLDTGTSFIGMPVSVFEDFARRIAAFRPDCMIDAGSGLIRCDRPTAAGLPPLSFSLQGHAFDLQGTDYFLQGVLGLMGIDIGTRTGFWILGDTFLKTYYTVFDMDNRKIGIVGAKPGLPYSPPEEEEGPLSRWSWQLIALIAGCALALVLIVGLLLRCCCPRRLDPADSPVLVSGAAPYVLHSQRPQPGYAPGTATYGAPARAPNSEFARDFYATPHRV